MNTRDALVEIEEVSAAHREDGVVLAGVDAPVAGEGSPTHSLELRGWAIGRAEPAVAVDLVHEGELLRQVPLDVERPRLAAAHPEAAGHAGIGFQSAIGALSLAPRFELELRAVLESGNRAPLARVRGRRAPLQTGYQARLPPLLVTTLGRTGSMVLMRMLEAHPELLVYRPFRYEQQVAAYWLDVLLTLSEPASYLRQIAPAGNLEDRLWWLGASTGPPQLRDSGLAGWMGSEGVRQLAQVSQERITAVYEQIAATAERPGARYFAEKHGLRTAQLARELYPQAAELFLVRDFRDMVASIIAFNERRGVQGFGRAGADTDSAWVAQQLADWASGLVAAWRRRSQGAHLVRYEDLVLHPRETLRGLLDHLGIESSDERVEQMLSAAAQEMPELAGHRTAGDARQSVGRWRSDLQPDVAAACEASFGEALAEFGYSRRLGDLADGR